MIFEACMHPTVEVEGMIKKNSPINLLNVTQVIKHVVFAAPNTPCHTIKFTGFEDVEWFFESEADRDAELTRILGL